MLKNTFIHIQGLGIKSEHRIWSSGVHSWDDLLRGSCPYVFHMREDTIKRCIEDSVEHRESRHQNLASSPQTASPAPEGRAGQEALGRHHGPKRPGHVHVNAPLRPTGPGGV